MLQAIHLLITHGSRNVRSQQSAEQLRSNIESYLNLDQSQSHEEQGIEQPIEQRIEQRIEHAVLEGGTTSLHGQILYHAARARAEGLNRLQLLPLFLTPGVHVMEDLPQEVALAQKQLVDRDPSFKLSTLPYLGHQLQTHPQSIALAWGTGTEMAADEMAAGEMAAGEMAAGEVAKVAKIVLSHGSRQSDSTLLSEQFAASIGATTAYWSIEPSLAQTVERLFTEGYEEIQVLLYFLFPGGITAAIEESIVELRQSYPRLNLTCKSTLDQISEFPKFIADVLQNTTFQNSSPQDINLQNRSVLPHSSYAEVNR